MNSNGVCLSYTVKNVGSVSMINCGDFATNLLQTNDGIWIPREAGDRDISTPGTGHDLSFEFEDDSYWFNHRNHVIIETVTNYHEHGCFFDIGGGSGSVTKGLMARGIETILVEPGTTGVEHARRHGVEHIIQSTVEAAGFKPGTMAAAGLFDVLEHYRDDVAFLESLHGLLAPGGKLFITAPACALLWSLEDFDLGHYHRYSLRSLGRKLDRAGYRVLYATYFFQALVLPAFIYRTLPFFFGATRKKEPKETPGKNSAFLHKMLARESKQLATGKRMRCGASCLVAVEKSG